MLLITINISSCTKKQKPPHKSNDRFAVAATSTSQVTMFLKKLKLLAKKGPEQLSTLIKYPLRVNYKNHSSWVNTPKQFTVNYRKIISNKIMEIINSQNIKKIFANSQGIMLGNGEIWARPVTLRKSSPIKIIVINKIDSP